MSPAKDGPESPLPSYDQERPAVRAQAVAEGLALTDPVARPTAVFTGGQPGAGKSHSIVQPLTVEYAARGGIVAIDPDELRPQFAQARAEMARGGTDFSPDAYNAAGTVAYEISQDLARHQRNILRDGTLASLRYPVQEMTLLREHDYRVEVHVAAVYSGLSLARTVARREQEAVQSATGFGRGVGREFHDQAVAGVATSTRTLWDNKDLVDRIVLYNSDGERIMDRVLHDGRWKDPAGLEHTGPAPHELLQRHQHEPRAKDLTEAASTWLRARDLLADPSRRSPPCEATVASVGREVARSLSLVAADSQAVAIAAGNDRLTRALDHHARHPLAAPAESWRRDSVEATRHWPEHAGLFKVADRVVARGPAERVDETRAQVAHQMATGALSRQLEAAHRVARQDVELER